MSHGCVNMRIVDAEKLYHWANPSTGDKNVTLSIGDNPRSKNNNIWTSAQLVSQYWL